MVGTKSARRLLLSGLFLLILCTCHREGTPSEGTVATLSGIPVKTSDLQETARFVGRPDLALRSLKKWPASVEKTIFQETVYDRLLLDDAQQEGLSVTDKEVSRERDRLSSASSPSGTSDHFVPAEALIRRKLLLEKAAMSVAPPPELSTKDLKAFYLEHKDRFSVQEKVVIRDIVVRSEDEGNSILSALKGGSSFSALAKVKSLSPEAKDGGLLPPYSMGEMPTPFYRAFQMKPGEVSPLIPSPYGYHILKLLRIIPPSVRPFSEVKKEIRSDMNRSAQDQLLKTWFAAQLKNHPLVILPPYRSTLSF